MNMLLTGTSILVLCQRENYNYIFIKDTYKCIGELKNWLPFI